MSNEKNTVTPNGTEIRKLRMKIGLTQEKLSELSGLTRKTIQRAEHGEELFPANLERIAAVLDVGLAELIVPQKDEEYNSSKEFFKDYRISFDSFIEERTREFVGRRFVFNAINEFIKNNRCGYFFVRGDPGIGKSSIAAQLVKEHGYIHHFNIRAEGINRTEVFLRNICGQLIVKYELDHLELPSDVADDNRFLCRLLDEAAEKSTSNNKIVIVIDALDEVDESLHHSGSNILYLPSRLPHGIFFIVTSRREHLPLRLECNKGEFNLDADSAGNQKDVEDYLKFKADLTGINVYLKKQKLGKPDFILSMKKKSQGNFMYLRYVIPEIERGAYADLSFESLPMGLENYYEDHWRRMGMLTKPLSEKKTKIVYILSEVHKPVSRTLLADFATESDMQVQVVLDEWDQFLHKEQQKDEIHYSIYHNSFRDFLNRKDIVQAAGVSLAAINDSIADSFFGDEND